MTAYQELLESNVMDPRFDLPLVPDHLNPHIFCAYAVRMLESNGDVGGSLTIRSKYTADFLSRCEKGSGLITTFPGSDIASHDDVYGAAFLDSRFAGRALDFLKHSDGIYSQLPTDVHRFYYRFIFFTPALKAWAGFRVGIFSQVQFSAALAAHMMTEKKGETSNHLLFWLALPAMRKGLISGPAVLIWSYFWQKRGVTPKSVFTNNYLTICPWFGKWAKDEWME